MKEMTCSFLKPFHNLKEQKRNLLSWHFEFCLSGNEPLKKKSVLIAQPFLLRLEAEFQCAICRGSLSDGQPVIVLTQKGSDSINRVSETCGDHEVQAQVGQSVHQK